MLTASGCVPSWAQRRLSNTWIGGHGDAGPSSCVGTLFLGPLAFGVFEEEAGSTNTSTIRLESSGLFVVGRPDAAATLAGGS